MKQVLQQTRLGCAHPTSVRHDGKGPLSLIASRISDTRELDHDMIKHYAAYLCTSPDLGLVFHPRTHPNSILRIWGANDASWRTDPATSRSRIAGGIKIGEQDTLSGCVEVFSHFEQIPISNSATVAEGKALSQNVKNVVVLAGILEDLGNSQAQYPTPLLIDSQSCHTIITRLVPHSQLLKHESGLYHFIEGYVKNNTIDPILVTSKNQPTDGLTKNIGTPRHLQSLPYTMGAQPAIDTLFTQYKDSKQTNKHSHQHDTDKHIALLVASMLTLDPISTTLLHDPTHDRPLLESRRLGYINSAIPTIEHKPITHITPTKITFDGTHTLTYSIYSTTDTIAHELTYYGMDVITYTSLSDIKPNPIHNITTSHNMTTHSTQSPSHSITFKQRWSRGEGHKIKRLNDRKRGREQRESDIRE